METTVDFESMYLYWIRVRVTAFFSFFFFFCYPCIVYENIGSRPGGGKYILVIVLHYYSANSILLTLLNVSIFLLFYPL